MLDKIQAIRGMNDILPHETRHWALIEAVCQDVMNHYGYDEIRTPLVESTHLFKRSIGEVTDIVEKEMYTFIDLNGDSLSLRPEGTASVVRAAIEHGLLHNQQQKLWYRGPMFRHEKPQKGRYRQFHQLGVEAFGYSGVEVELEQVLLCYRLWQKLGIAEVVSLQVNSIGTLAERDAYKLKLIQYFEQHPMLLDDDSKRRLHRNPLRILDSKNPDMTTLIADAPKLVDHLSDESRAHFDNLCSGLQQMKIPYVINPDLVRGLDYYCHSVFEWVTDKLGSQATVCAGGRYDLLVEQLGGRPTAAVGFALGLERLLILMQELDVQGLKDSSYPLVMFICDSFKGRLQALKLAEDVRNQCVNVEVLVNLSTGGFKSQFKKADKSMARFAVIIGEDELANERLTVKYLREDKDQLQLRFHELGPWLAEQLQ